MVWRRIWRCKNNAAWNSLQRTARAPHGVYRRSFPESGLPLVEFSSPLFFSPPGGVRSFHKQGLWSMHNTDTHCFSSQAWVDLPTAGVVEVPLAQTGEGIAECELLKWFVQEGDEVDEFQRLCEVQSDKATIEITSRYKGKIYQLLFVPGNLIKVGETLLKIIVEEPETSALNSECLDNRNFVNPLTSELRHQSSLNNKEQAGGVLSSPSIRHLAKQYGLNINDILGTGKDGRILKEDVMNCAAIRGIIKESSSLPCIGTEDLVLPKVEISHADGIREHFYEDKSIPIRGFQRSMVKSMTMAAKVPHFHYVEEINCDALVELKAAFQSQNTDPNVKHTYLPFLIKSLSMALDRYPLLNSSFNEELNEIILKGAHNIGVAMTTPFGLVVPNIKKVQSLSILEITKELSRLQLMASSNKLSSEDISGGTITLSNIGSVGGKFGSPLLNLPEVAIIAIGRFQKLPRFADDGTVYPASITNVCIGADHRVVDGAAVAKFCKEWKLLIEKPEILLLHMR